MRIQIGFPAKEGSSIVKQMKNNRKLFWLTLSVSLALGAFTATAWWIVGERELDQYPKEFSFENIRQIDFQCALEYYSDQSRH